MTRALAWPGAGVIALAVAEATSRTVSLALSVMYRSFSGSREMLWVDDISDVVAGPPSPELPLVPAALPATVYSSPAVIDWPHWVPGTLAISWMRLFCSSAMYRSPVASMARLGAPAMIVALAGPPSACRVAAAPPVTVYSSPAVIDWPHWVPGTPAISWIRLFCSSAMYRSPVASMARLGAPAMIVALAGPPSACRVAAAPPVTV